MANIRLIKGRIKSAKNISQITKAMELVAASKMRKAQSQALSGKLYASKIYEMVLRLSSKVTLVEHPLLAKPTGLTGKRLVIVLSTNKGLCGGLNTNLFRYLVSQYEGLTRNDYVVFGKKGVHFLVQSKALVIADFSQSVPFSSGIQALTELVTKEFLAQKYDGVDLIYNEFISALRQNPKKKTILPLSISGAVPPEEDTKETLVEPSYQEVFDELLPHYLENQIRDAVLQSEASEHSARMVAMRNATDNADSLAGELTLVYNKARQEKITYEITDMVTARLAVEV
ncbi:MAG: ATP synthase F1 subunit gamma [Patescibacteria group bacterium]